MEPVTFQDFAGAVMGGDTKRAAEVLEALLGLDHTAATSAAEHFASSMAADPQFIMKAMGLRAAVTSGSDEDIAVLLRDVFGLPAAATPNAVSELRKRYPA